MRGRRDWSGRLVLVSAGVLGGVVTTAPAGAQESTTSTVADTAQEATTSWPVTILALVAFVAVAYFSVRIGRRSFETAAQARAERTARQEDAVASAIAGNDAIRQQYESEIRDAATEVDRIIEEQRRHAIQVSEDAARAGRVRLEAIRSQAAAEHEAMRGAAVSDVQDEAAQIAADLARAIVPTDPDEAATKQLIDGYLDRRRAPD